MEQEIEGKKLYFEYGKLVSLFDFYLPILQYCLI